MNDENAQYILLEARRIRIPMLAFRGEQPALSVYYGLVRFGPYELPVSYPKTILIVYPNKSEFREVAKRVKEALENGYKGYFPEGFASIFDLNVEFDLVAINPNKYTILDPQNTALEYYERFSEVSKTKNNDCFLMALINKVPQSLHESLYTEIKFLSTKNNVPSQIITYEVFSDEGLFKWSIFPLALQIFVKMGGTPFLLYNRLRIPEEETALIIGIGLSRISLGLKEIRYVGFALAFEPNGKWRLIRWSQQPYDRKNLPYMFEKLIRDVIDEVLRKYAVSTKRIHVIIHYSGKNISVAEEVNIKAACEQIKEMKGLEVMPYVVKINDSMYRLYDEANPCPDSSGLNTFLPWVGTTIKLKDDLYMLQTTGCVKVQTSCGAMRSRPNAFGSPSPILVSIKRLSGIQYELRDLDLVKSVLYMCRMNYVSVNNPVSRLPITVKYSRRLAYITSKFAASKNIDINAIVPQKIARTLWFV
ncbi:MAG: hypothetical protein J7J99_07225 [Thermoprotei archaeon]|nr:hypothetical protein [Thermoprotei archaeon]